MSPYAAALRAALLLPGSKASDEVRALLSLDPPNFRGAAQAWMCQRWPPGCSPTKAAATVEQIRRWIAGDVACRVKQWQPPGYTPPPKRNGRPVQLRKWHAEAGTAPDGVVAERHGVSLAAVRDYRRRAKIPAFKAAKGGGS
jgi:hypothetical protein